MEDTMSEPQAPGAEHRREGSQESDCNLCFYVRKPHSCRGVMGSHSVDGQALSSLFLVCR